MAFSVRVEIKRYFCELLYGFESVCKINAFRLKGEKLISTFSLFTITYYLPKIDKEILVKSEE